MPFDYEGAMKAGYSAEEIVNHLETSGEADFDIKGAKDAGYSLDEIFSHLHQGPAQPTINTSKPADIPEITPYQPDEQAPTQTYGLQQEGTIQSEDNKATIPSELEYQQDGTATAGMQSQLDKVEPFREAAQEEANVQGFASYIDPKTGENVKVTEAGIQPDLPLIIGPAKVSLFSIEGAMAARATSAKVAAHIGEKFAEHQAANLAPNLSTEAMYIVGRHPSLTEAQVLESLKGVAKEDQAYALARQLGETNYIKQATRAEGDVGAGLVRNELETARAKILETVGTVDIPRAKAKYADMIDNVASDYHNVHNATPILEDLNFLERFYGVTPSAGNRTVTQIKATLRDNPNINLSDALEFRADLNYLISKASRGREKVKLNSIKDNLDTFIHSVASPEQKAMIDDAISTYSRTMQNRDVLELVTKNSDESGIAVNWTKLHRDLNDANLRSPEAVDALRVAEAFAKRFGNDKKLITVARPAGSSPDSGGVLGAWGYIINHLKDTFAVYGNRAENLKIQKAIMKSLKKGTTNLDFVNVMKANKDIPDEVVKVFEDTLQITYNPKAKQTGDVNLNPIIPPVGGKDIGQVVDDIAPTKEQIPKEVLDWHKTSNQLTKNEDGTPKVFYHGTSADFTAFDKKKMREGRLGKGFYFTDDIEIAKQYGDNIKEVYLKADKTYNHFTRKSTGSGKDFIMKYGNEYIINNPKQIMQKVSTKVEAKPIESLDIKEVQNYIGAKKGTTSEKLDTMLKDVVGDYEGPAIRGEINQELAKMKVGDSYTTKGVTSIGKDKETAKVFANEEFQGKKGPKVFITFNKFKNKPINLGTGNKLGLDDVAMAPKEGSTGSYLEDEVIIPSGRNFKIVDRKVKDGEVHITVDEL